MKNLKRWFEERYLDGDKMQNGQFISSKECFEAVKDALAEREKKIVEMINEYDRFHCGSCISETSNLSHTQFCNFRNDIINLITKQK